MEVWLSDDVQYLYTMSCLSDIYYNSNKYTVVNQFKLGGRDGIVEETPIHVYYAYLKPTWGYGFNSLVVLCVG